MSPGLLRARAPFRIQNALTGVVLAGFATAVWAYSIRAVKQDDFSDVDEEAREMMLTKSSREQTGGLGVGGESSVVGNQGGEVDVDVVGTGAMSREGTSGSASNLAVSTWTGSGIRVRPQSRPRGVLAPILDRAFPHVLDPMRKTLVWGAPPMDDLGRVCLRSSTEERR